MSLRKTGGRRECRVHAAPAVSCAVALRKAHTSIQVKRRQSGIPCAMVLRLISRSPWGPGFLAPIISVMRSIIANLTPASGRQDHTTSPYASGAVRRLAPSRPPHPAPRFVTTARTPLRVEAECPNHAADLGSVSNGFRKKRTLGCDKLARRVKCGARGTTGKGSPQLAVSGTT